ncbi:MAG: T9SS type A sorting domain-containing protein [Vicingaceae bacterium]
MHIKRILTSLLVLLILTPSSTKASHTIGGEIWWECLGNGEFVFHAKIYRDCTGIPFNFSPLDLEIFGNSLPRNSANAIISTLSLKPDSTSWLATNKGDISPDCQDVGGVFINCERGGYGAYQELPYQSDPIHLNGTPPATGWRFSIELPCCRPNLINLASQGQSILSAIMYPNGNNDPVDNCYNSSPRFAEKPNYFSCRREMKYVNHAVIDAENDSVVYSFARTYNVPAANPTPVPYVNGYNYDNPTPDSTIYPANIPASLDSSNGILSYLIHSWNNEYYVVVRADEYRNGTKISSIFREYPVFSIGCPTDTFSSANSSLNGDVIINGNYNSKFDNSSNVIRVKTGRNIKLSLNARLVDSLGKYGMYNSSLTNSFKISSPQFSRSLNDSTLCQEPPCAVLEMNNPTIFDSSLQAFVGSSNSKYLGTINWETNCAHLDSIGGSQVYQFNIETTTTSQLCDTLVTVSGTHAINVEVSNDSSSSLIPDLKCVNMVSTDDEMVLSWDTAGIPKDSFSHWSVFSSRPNGQFGLVDTLEQYYLGSTINPLAGHRFNEVAFSRLDSTFMPEVYLRANTRNCNLIIPNPPSDTFSRYISIQQVDDRLVVQTSPALPVSYTYTWFSCNPNTGAVDSSHGISFTPKDTGYYSVGLALGEPDGYCSGRSECVLYSPVGLKERTLESRLKVYPNPTKGLINLDNASNEILRLKVYNIQGKLLQEKKVKKSSNQIEIEGDAGLYFFTLTNTRGEQATYKVVKQ